MIFLHQHRSQHLFPSTASLLLTSLPLPPLPLPPFPAYGGLKVVVGFKPPTLFCAFYFKLIHWLHFLQIIKEGKDQDDLNELAKLFDIHKAG